MESFRSSRRLKKFRPPGSDHKAVTNIHFNDLIIEFVPNSATPRCSISQRELRKELVLVMHLSYKGF